MDAFVGIDELVELLRAGSHPALALEDVAVMTGIVSWAVSESRRDDATLVEQLGLEADDLRDFLVEVFPRFDHGLLGDLGGPLAPLSEEESCLRRLLGRFATGGSWLESRLARILARRCLRPNHLWQDLGLASRGELTELMRRHFAPLAARNSGAMRWKKFLYRAICMDDHHGVCTSPTCAECGEFETCFGDETGPSLLARIARGNSTV